MAKGDQVSEWTRQTVFRARTGSLLASSTPGSSPPGWCPPVTGEEAETQSEGWSQVRLHPQPGRFTVARIFHLAGAWRGVNSEVRGHWNQLLQ